ncbi:rab-GTPase-TBC domain-containing protein [Polychytrium aggregatum]|uniref:rab-GTPase-TBC domain-containing protein n=1 Tax=Polychytrium aggregatum TaxID=110093 RepID=UPI0022FF4076|nr:rab-GTPase-TBC domain-containing protein [Polychytrium aggregatum]KAI9206233.1 rab-GTPase-TBC domain-containing protein [Polychytrium aggregatum]
MHSIEHLKRTWDAFWRQPNLSAGLLRERAKSGQITPLALRSLYWKIFLEYLPNLNPLAWPVVLQKERRSYEDLKSQFYFDPNKESGDIANNNPLSDQDDSPWARYFQDAELQKVIKQDVERTFPDQPFFKEPEVTAMMCNILFVWSKMNPDVSYRQGMHEILAPVLLVVHHDKVEPEALKSGLEPIIHTVFDSKYVEHDAAVIFFRIMKSARSWYEVGTDAQQVGPKMGKYINEPKVLPIVAYAKKIQSDDLRILDYDLFSHLEKLKIEPQLYAMRWVRLLFGREVTFAELLLLWDSIFAEDPGLGLVEWICVSFLVTFRNDLIASDYSAALFRLMRLPSLESQNITVPSLISTALTLRARYLQKAAVFSSPANVPPSRSSGLLPGKPIDPPARPSSRNRVSQRWGPSNGSAFTDPLRASDPLLGESSTRGSSPARAVSEIADPLAVNSTVAGVPGSTLKRGSFTSTSTPNITSVASSPVRSARNSFSNEPLSARVRISELETKLQDYEQKQDDILKALLRIQALVGSEQIEPSARLERIQGEVATLMSQFSVVSVASLGLEIAKADSDAAPAQPGSKVPLDDAKTLQSAAKIAQQDVEAVPPPSQDAKTPQGPVAAVSPAQLDEPTALDSASQPESNALLADANAGVPAPPQSASVPADGQETNDAAKATVPTVARIAQAGAPQADPLAVSRTNSRGSLSQLLDPLVVERPATPHSLESAQTIQAATKTPTPAPTASPSLWEPKKLKGKGLFDKPFTGDPLSALLNGNDQSLFTTKRSESLRGRSSLFGESSEDFDFNASIESLNRHRAPNTGPGLANELRLSIDRLGGEEPAHPSSSEIPLPVQESPFADAVMVAPLAGFEPTPIKLPVAPARSNAIVVNAAHTNGDGAAVFQVESEDDENQDKDEGESGDAEQSTLPQGSFEVAAEGFGADAVGSGKPIIGFEEIDDPWAKPW